VVLEWDYSKGQPTVPLVKDKYGSERRKAKILNFSIAYGKTVHGLAQDWGISKEEAQETLNAWYADRPEVKEWQEKTQEYAKRRGYVRTVMGRLAKSSVSSVLHFFRRCFSFCAICIALLPPFLSPRYRRLPEAVPRFDESGRLTRSSTINMGHAMRASINTPIQGSAADIVMMAMIKLWKSEELKRLGWKLLLQIHDEVILEGPKESRDEVR
jgi:DNA polymerase-1